MSECLKSKQTKASGLQPKCLGSASFFSLAPSRKSLCSGSVLRVAKGPAGKDSVEVVMSTIPGNWSLWPEDHEFGASLGYIVNLCSKYKQNIGHGGVHLSF